jgi:hypothetical protein
MPMMSVHLRWPRPHLSDSGHTEMCHSYCVTKSIWQKEGEAEITAIFATNPDHEHGGV